MLLAFGGGSFASSLLMKIFTRKKPPTKEVKEVRVTVLGLDNSGKTTILKAIAHEDI